MVDTKMVQYPGNEQLIADSTKYWYSTLIYSIIRGIQAALLCLLRLMQGFNCCLIVARISHACIKYCSCIIFGMTTWTGYMVTKSAWMIINTEVKKLVVVSGQNFCSPYTLLDCFDYEGPALDYTSHRLIYRSVMWFKLMPSSMKWQHMHACWHILVSQIRIKLRNHDSSNVFS